MQLAPAELALRGDVARVAVAAAEFAPGFRRVVLRPGVAQRAGQRASHRGRHEAADARLAVLSSFDEGPDLVLYYKHMMVLEGSPEYGLHFNASDELTANQKHHCETQLAQFKRWYADWSTPLNWAASPPHPGMTGSRNSWFQGAGQPRPPSRRYGCCQAPRFPSS